MVPPHHQNQPISRKVERADRQSSPRSLTIARNSELITMGKGGNTLQTKYSGHSAGRVPTTARNAYVIWFPTRTGNTVISQSFLQSVFHTESTRRFPEFSDKSLKSSTSAELETSTGSHLCWGATCRLYGSRSMLLQSR